MAITIVTPMIWLNVPCCDSTPGMALMASSMVSVWVDPLVAWSIAWPAARSQVRALIVLHGRGDDQSAVLGRHRLGAYLADVVAKGTPPFAVCGVDGGRDSYWHARASGINPQKMVVRELLPVLRQQGLLVDRFALGGWSMGGYGALLLAEVLGRTRVAAVVADSPAVFVSAKDVSRGSFDGPEDFERHDVVRHVARLEGVPTRVTCGTSDPFMPGVRKLLAAAPQIEHDLAPGRHDLAWWLHAAPGQLAFAGRHLSLQG